MRTTLLCFLFIFLNLNSYSQPIFQTAYGNNDVEDIKGIVLFNNYYYFIGQTTNPVSLDADISFFCIDNEGGLLWSVILGTSKDDYVRGLIKTADGGFALTGETFGGFIDSTTSDIFLIKTDDQGFPLLSETYGGPGSEVGGGIIEGSDGSFYLSGTTFSYGNVLGSALLIRTDAIGNQIWTSVNSAMDWNWMNGLIQKPTGELVASGFCYPDAVQTHYNYVVTIDTSGNLIQAKRSGNGNHCILSDLILTNDGGYATCGQEFVNSTTQNMNVCKYDSSGNRLWNKTFGTNQDDAYSITETDNGDLIVSGKTNIGSIGSPDFKSSIIRMDNSGNIIWAKTYGYLPSYTQSRSVIKGIDQTFVSAGLISDPLAGTNAHIIKTDASGTSGCYENIYSPITSTISFTDSLGADWQVLNMVQFSFNPFWQSLSNQFTLYCFGTDLAEVTDNSAMIFPNPGTGIFRIETESAGEHHVEIFDAVGQKIIDEVFYQNHIDIDLKNYSAGMYYFRIDNVNSKKVILTGN